MSVPGSVKQILGSGSIEQLGPATFASADRVCTASRSPRTHAQLLEVHRSLAPALEASGVRIPRLLDHTDALVVVERVPGIPLATGLQPVGHLPDGVIAAAARWLDALRAAPIPKVDPLSLDKAARKRILTILEALPERWIRALEAHLDPSVLAGQTRSWCHRDFHPRNWLWDGRTLTVIDWEHARPDHPAVDLARVPLAVSRSLEAACRIPVDPAAIRLFRVMDAAGTLAWGTRHGAEAYVRDGVARLQEVGICG